MGHLRFIFLDDSFGGQLDKVSDPPASIIPRGELSTLGLLRNGEKKSHWAPVHVWELLGFVVNAIAMNFFGQTGRFPS